MAPEDRPSLHDRPDGTGMCTYLPIPAGDVGAWFCPKCGWDSAGPPAIEGLRNDLAAALMGHFGWLPLSVRYGAADAAIAAVHAHQAIRTSTEDHIGDLVQRYTDLPEPPKVVDLMAALEKSVREAKAARRTHPINPPEDA